MIVNHRVTFKGLLSLFGLIGAVIFLILVGVLGSQGSWLLAVIVLILAICCVSLFLRFRGVEFDLDGKKFRVYEQHFVFKFGSWRSLKEFEKLILHTDRVSYAKGRFELGGRVDNTTFDVALHNAKTKETILLAECMSYKKGLTRLFELSRELDLPYLDVIALRKQRSSQKR